MCVACHEPLAVSQSPEAFSERSFIRVLIAQGLTKAQIEKQMVANYGAAVLAKPPASGFNLPHLRPSPRTAGDRRRHAAGDDPTLAAALTGRGAPTEPDPGLALDPEPTPAGFKRTSAGHA